MTPTIEDVLKDDVREQWLIGQVQSLRHSGFSETKASQIAVEQWEELKTKFASLQTPSNEKYWRERCEAAEEHITVLCNHPKGKIRTEAWKKWQELKSTPIPIQTPCVWVKVEDRLPEDGQIVDIWEMPMTQHLERALSLKGTSYANEYYHNTDYNGWRSSNYKFTIEEDQDGVMNCFTKLEEKYLSPLSSYSYKKLCVENGEVTHWMPLPTKPNL